MGNIHTEREKREYFEEIYNNTGKAVYRYIASKCYDIDDIRDLYQETFFQIYKKVASSDIKIENPEAFAITVAKKQLSKHYSIAKRLKNSIEVYKLDLESEKYGDKVDCAAAAEESVTVKRAYRIISSKPPTVRKILFLRLKLEMSFGEISSQTGISKKNTERIYYKTISELRRRLRNTDDSEMKCNYDETGKNGKESI